MSKWWMYVPLTSVVSFMTNRGQGTRQTFGQRVSLRGLFATIRRRLLSEGVLTLIDIPSTQIKATKIARKIETSSGFTINEAEVGCVLSRDTSMGPRFDNDPAALSGETPVPPVLKFFSWGEECLDESWSQLCVVSTHRVKLLPPWSRALVALRAAVVSNAGVLFRATQDSPKASRNRTRRNRAAASNSDGSSEGEQEQNNAQNTPQRPDIDILWRLRRDPSDAQWLQLQAVAVPVRQSNSSSCIQPFSVQKQPRAASSRASSETGRGNSGISSLRSMSRCVVPAALDLLGAVHSVGGGPHRTTQALRDHVLSLVPIMTSAQLSRLDLSGSKLEQPLLGDLDEAASAAWVPGLEEALLTPTHATQQSTGGQGGLTLADWAEGQAPAEDVVGELSSWRPGAPPPGIVNKGCSVSVRAPPSPHSCGPPLWQPTFPATRVGLQRVALRGGSAALRTLYNAIHAAGRQHPIPLSAEITAPEFTCTRHLALGSAHSMVGQAPGDLWLVEAPTGRKSRSKGKGKDKETRFLKSKRGRKVKQRNYADDDDAFEVRWGKVRVQGKALAGEG